jgi:hypothetical protein
MKNWNLYAFLVGMCKGAGTVENSLPAPRKLKRNVSDCRYTPAIPACGRRRQEDCKFQASLGWPDSVFKNKQKQQQQQKPNQTNKQTKELNIEFPYNQRFYS